MTNYQNSVVDNYPLYQAFIDLYYAFVLQRQQAVGAVVYHSAKLDIDRTLDKEVDKFYDTYAKNLPQSIAYDKRNLVKILNQIYEAKGTENSLKLLFRLIYNEDVQVSYPNENVLIPSSGRWKKEKYFTCHVQFGMTPPENSRLVFSNERGDFSIIVTGMEMLDDNTCRIRFSSLDRVYIPLEQIITHTDGENTYFIGKVIPSPQKLRILRAGKYWKKGKALVIPGKIRDTVAVISSVGTGGVITGLEILEYGIGHDLNQVSIISPFPRKPTGSIQDIGFEITSINPAAVGPGFTDHPGVTYHHLLNIEDYVDGIGDEVTGTAAGYTHNSYFLSYYLLEDYIGTVEFITSTKTASSIDNVGRDTDIKTWQDSLALIMYEHDSLVDMKGKYSGDEGQLSNQLIKIQDSYFYQAFSYLLESIQDPKAYRKMADLFHPAGTKRFSGYIKQIDEALQYQFRRAFLVDTIVLREHMSFADSRPEILFTKEVLDFLDTPPDAIQYKIDVKTLLDTQIIDPSVYAKFVVKPLFETITYLDINPKTVVKPFVLDFVITPDVYTKGPAKFFTLDSVVSTQIDIRTVTKPRVDIITYTDDQVPKLDWKILNDSQTQIDLRPEFNDTKPLSDNQSIIESLRNSIIKAGSNFSDGTTIIHTLNSINLNKPFTDVATSSHLKPLITGTKGVADFETPIDTRPRLTPLKSLLESVITVEQYAKTINKTSFIETVGITSVDGNGTLVDGRWDIDYAVNTDQYSEPFKYLIFS